MARTPRKRSLRLGPRVLHVHASDAVRDVSRGRALEVELGRGSADLPGLLGRLTEFDYRGWVTIERHDSADPVTEIGNAVAFLCCKGTDLSSVSKYRGCRFGQMSAPQSA